jgi:hypothetical protein
MLPLLTIEKLKKIIIITKVISGDLYVAPIDGSIAEELPLMRGQ